MIEFLMILTFLCAIVYFYWQMKHALHMFQQNRYELPRYLYWMKTQWKTEKKACINLFIKESLLVGIFIITRAFSLNSRLLLTIYMTTMIMMTYLNYIQETKVPR